MDTDTHDTDTDETHDDHGHVEGFDKSHDLEYWIIALILAVLTGLEVTTYSHEDTWGDLAVPGLIVMMSIKFVMITWFFMHLKGDWKSGNPGGKFLTYVFYAGLALALAVYIATLAAFRLF